MFQYEGRYIARTMAPQTIIAVREGSTTADGLLSKVMWDEQEVLVFTQDLQTRTEPAGPTNLASTSQAISKKKGSVF